MIWIYEVARGISREGELTAWTEVASGIEPKGENIRNVRQVVLYNPLKQQISVAEAWEIIRPVISEMVEEYY